MAAKRDMETKVSRLFSSFSKEVVVGGRHVYVYTAGSAKSLPACLPGRSYRNASRERQLCSRTPSPLAPCRVRPYVLRITLRRVSYPRASGSNQWEREQRRMPRLHTLAAAACFARERELLASRPPLIYGGEVSCCKRVV